MANTETTIRGLEEMYWEECDKIEKAVGKTVDEITILQAGLTDRLAQSFHQKAGLMEAELISARN